MAQLDLATIVDCQTIWLDQYIGESGNNEDIKNKFRLIMSTLITFTNVEECLQFIRSNNQKKLFIITSGTLGRQIVPIINDLPQLNSVYIYCSDVARNTSWAIKYPKIKDICDAEDELLNRFTNDIAQYIMTQGDHYTKIYDTVKAKFCYSYANELFTRVRS
ncbi:unnamed protein product [Didymodactylos carnosus]|uniref:Uncharacterized protein n=2 Tax=Didymodactylos carnosus TaxID=1234261 RepID=A0A815AN09_9BILA|nr:unnamed protein product [Didymodactylos carnosus]CAF4035807.1 unnamed protein product [Didymodactylos carnosus]